MLNKVGRDIPTNIPALEGREVYQGEFAIEPKAHRAGKPVHMSRVGTNKVLASIDEAIEKAGVKDGMTLSFHHHLRNGDYVMKMVMERVQAKGIKDITIASSSLSPCHEFLVEMIQDGTVTAIETSGLRDRLGRFLTQNPGVLKRPVVIRSHGGRARAIESGEVHIDVAFMAAPTADPRGNATGRMGKSACGALGYAKVDSHYADTTVIITDNLVDYVHNYAIPQTDVDYVVEVESIGDPEGIASGAVGFTKNPIQIKIAEGEVGGFAIGGATGILTGMLEEGLIRAIYDTQTFDTTAAASLDKNPAHIEMSASMYANPWTDCTTNYLDVVFLGATEIDLDFNVNVMTDSNGVLMGASGGHSDTAAGAKCTVITCPLIRGRLPMIRDKVATVITPGSSVDVLVTEYGIAINPARTDLIERFKDSNLPIFTIEELQQLAFDLVGKPQDIPVSDKDEDIIAIVEYRDGSIIDVVRKPL
ncbi:MAG: citrate lyase subunit alpha [Veillonella sp.]|nr:citrate lyase subunit alpha [Veillonella sp.]